MKPKQRNVMTLATLLALAGDIGGPRIPRAKPRRQVFSTPTLEEHQQRNLQAQARRMDKQSKRAMQASRAINNNPTVKKDNTP